MSHQCPAVRCPVRVDLDQLMCPQHWRMVPGPFRSAVWIAWKDGAGAGTSQHTAAIEAAVRSVNEKLAR